MRPASLLITLCASPMLAALVACVEPPAQTRKNEPAAVNAQTPVQAQVQVQIMNTADGATHCLNRDEPWFEHPAQARPPNGRLAEKTRVRILQDAGSYTKVQTDDGITCFVASEALSPLPGQPAAKGR
jgi:hypothetical protein